MATIKCENCGTTLEISDNASIVFCHNCGTKCSVQQNDSKDVFLKRGFLALEDKEWKKAASLWVFAYTSSSASDCAPARAHSCGYGVRSNSDMRSGLFGSVRK